MEAAGFAFSIVGLYSSCEQCYQVYCDYKGAADDAVKVTHQLIIQQSILKAWGFYWEIPTNQRNFNDSDDGEEKEKEEKVSNGKLKRYLEKHRHKAKGIASALYLIGDALSDKEKLLKNYGLKVNLETTAENTAEVRPREKLLGLQSEIDGMTSRLRARMTTFHKCSWVLKDKSKFKALLKDLIDYNDSLQTLSPDGAIEQIDINLVLGHLSRSPDPKPDEIREVNQLLQTDSDTEQSSPSRQGIQMLSDITDIRASVNRSGDPVTEEEEKSLLSFQPSDLQLRSRNMAVWKAGKQTVYIEEHQYFDLRPWVEKTIRENILKLGRLLQNPMCSKWLLTMELLGLVEFTNKNSIGLVYKLPGTLGKPRKGLPIDDTDIREPVNLSELYIRRPSLTLRFELAKKLAQSVIFLHASGWLHKNIRGQSVLFFPEPAPIQLQTSLEMDYENPFLMGFQFSRPDDSQYRPQSPVMRARSMSPSRPTAIASLPHKIIRQASLENTESMRKCEEETSNTQESERETLDKDAGDSSDGSIETASRSPPTTTYEPRRIELDVRHHPTKRVNPDRKYCHAFDIYSLGILLVEIGLWADIAHVEFEGDGKVAEIADPYKASRMIKSLAGQIRYRCGSRYKDVTIKCLTVDPEDEEESKAGLIRQRELCAQIVAGLAQCQA